MRAYYTYDELGFLTGSGSVSKYGTRPHKSTFLEPPDNTDDSIHPVFNGSGWSLVDKTPFIEKQIKQQRNIMTAAVTKYIQEAVDQYNTENGTAFDSVHNCAAYKDIMSYSHNVFCNSVLEWNAAVWDMARSIESEVVAGNREIPSVDELIEYLPKFDLEEYHA